MNFDPLTTVMIPKPAMPRRHGPLSPHRADRASERPAASHRPIQPGYYLIRLRLQYTHKGTRPLARIL